MRVPDPHENPGSAFAGASPEGYFPFVDDVPVRYAPNIFFPSGQEFYKDLITKNWDPARSESDEPAATYVSPHTLDIGAWSINSYSRPDGRPLDRFWVDGWSEGGVIHEIPQTLAKWQAELGENTVDFSLKPVPTEQYDVSECRTNSFTNVYIDFNDRPHRKYLGAVATFNLFPRPISLDGTYHPDGRIDLKFTGSGRAERLVTHGFGDIRLLYATLYNIELDLKRSPEE